MNDAYKKLIKTLRTLFEMDKADLDFGIYRILNQKRDEIDRFLEHDLLPQVKEAFADFATSGKSELQAQLAEAIEQAKQFGAPDPEQAPAVQAIKAQLANAIDMTAVENEIYSHLYTFFSRYYDQGDFISQRRYKADTYAIPYEGEEVKLYWANHDQYYVKSSEHLRDYAFTVKGDDGKTVRIKLIEADTEKDNVKAKKDEERRFVVDSEQPLVLDGDDLQIRFHYIPVGKKKQDTLNAEAVKTIFAQKGFDDWLELLRTTAPTESNKDRTLLEKHLNDYTARNTFDYFIHKDLGGFLRRELDFYIKNEVLYLDDIDEAGFEVTQAHLRKIKVLRSIAHKIIRMLAQMEDFQKKLWLKKKFVVESSYCIQIGEIPEEFYAEIAENSDQREEWVRLCAIDKIKGDLALPSYTIPLAVEFLKAHPTLMIDTRHFSYTLTSQILSSFEDLEEVIDGVFFKGENFQALSLSQCSYAKQLKCIYIDPPYNTGDDGFAYKDRFMHSSWQSMFNDRIKLGRNLLGRQGLFLSSIDDIERDAMTSITDTHFGREGRVGVLVWKGSTDNNPTRIAAEHEYILCYANSKKDLDEHWSNASSEAKELMLQEYERICKETDSVSEREERFKEFAKDNRETLGDLYRYRRVDARGPHAARRNMENPGKPGYQDDVIHPITKKPCAKPYWGWRFPPTTMRRLLDEDRIIFGEDETKIPELKVYLTEVRFPLRSVFHMDARKGSNDLNRLFGSRAVFKNPKPTELISYVLSFMTSESSMIGDYFAGSGTTGHAVISLNRKDGGKRKFFLIDQGDSFETVLLARMKKVAYMPDWKEGKPEPIAAKESTLNNPRIFKINRLESYEDTLNNLQIRSRSKPQSDMLEENSALREDYMLGYWLDVETADSPSLLNIDQFEDPFDYKLNIATGSVGAFKPTRVDLVETFNYLLGLRVKHIDTIRGFKVVTGTNPQDETVLVVWRKLKEQDNAALEAFMEKQTYHPRDTEFDHIYVNGDHTLEDPHSKVKLTETEFKRLMFDVQDV